jgi:hypothetical protein
MVSGPSRVYVAIRAFGQNRPFTDLTVQGPLTGIFRSRLLCELASQGL